ncbi:MAG: hypothetical protein AB1589_06680 [Cyanobacteriota bacterium]
MLILSGSVLRGMGLENLSSLGAVSSVGRDLQPDEVNLWSIFLIWLFPNNAIAIAPFGTLTAKLIGDR